MSSSILPSEAPHAAQVAITSNGASCALSPTERLHLVRRIDWRFLLPDPELRAVAYFGPADSMLHNALRHFSTLFSHWQADADQDQSMGQHDLVVVCQGDEATIRQATALVRPGGSLYLETSRKRVASGKRRGSSSTRCGSPAAGRALLEQLGLTDVEAHWHWPNFDACAELVSLDQPQAIEHALSRRRSSAASRRKAAICRLLLKAGWLERVIPCFSLLARKAR